MWKASASLASVLLALVLASGAALAATPSETPDPTHMVNGPVRAIAQVGDNLWLGGDFTRVQKRNGTVVAKVSNVAVFDAATGTYRPGIAPKLGAGSSASKVTEIEVYDDNGARRVLIGGTFAGPSPNKRNLLAVDAASGQTLRWYDSIPLESVLAAPDLGRIYAGGESLQAFEFASARKLWTRARTSVDQAPHSSFLRAGYRDLERDADGRTIWAACACDAVDGSPSKSLVKLDVDGGHDISWSAQAEADSFGISLVDVDGALYLAAGGTDFLAEYSKADGTRNWTRDTSGSTQVVEVMDGQLVVGGHFLEVSDDDTPADTDPATADYCGFRSSNSAVTLDPNDECQTRKGLAVYSLDGALDPEWDPALAGRYNLAWALHPEATPTGTRLHVGGEFLTASGVRQTHYARFSAGT